MDVRAQLGEDAPVVVALAGVSEDDKPMVAVATNEAARKNGITRTEIAEILTHAAFYAGWPKAWAALRMAKEGYSEGDSHNAR